MCVHFLLIESRKSGKCKRTPFVFIDTELTLINFNELKPRGRLSGSIPSSRYISRCSSQDSQITDEDFRWNLEARRDPSRRRIVKQLHKTCSTMSALLPLFNSRADVELAVRMAVRSREHPTMNSERRTRRGGGTFAEVEERSPRSEAGSRRD